MKNLRSLLDMQNDSLFPVAVVGDTIRDALVEANRQQLTRADGQALLSLTLEMSDNTRDVTATAMEIHRAYSASKS